MKDYSLTFKEIELSKTSSIIQINKCIIDNQYRVCSHNCENCKLNQPKPKFYEEYKNSKWEE